MAESLWYPSTTPTGTDASGNYSGVTKLVLGTGFGIDHAGTISGIAYWRNNSTLGTSVTVALYQGNAANQAGSQVAIKTTTVTSAVGWKVVNFDTPVTVAAGDWIVAAVLPTPAGDGTVYYKALASYFPVDNATYIPAASGYFRAFNDSGLGELQSPYSKKLLNGLFVESATGSMAEPENSFNQSNYWVDIIYNAQANAYTLTADTRAFTLTRNNGTLRLGRKLIATSRSFALTSIDTGLKIARKTALTKGTFTLSGQDASLRYPPDSNTSIIAEEGSFLTTGIAASLRQAKRMAVETGYINLDGLPIGLGRPTVIEHDYGTFTLTSVDALFVLQRVQQSSGAKDYTPDISEFIEEAYERCGVEVRTGYQARTARRSINLMLAEWANRGLNHWTVEQLTITVEDDTSYPLGQDTIDIIGAVIRVGNIDRTLTRVSREEWLAIPNKEQPGTPVQFYVDRQINPRLRVWPAPDAPYTITYDRLVRMDKGASSRQTLQLPFRFYPCFAAGLAYYLSLKVAPDRTAMLRQVYEEEFARAASEDRDRASFFVLPKPGRR